MNPWAEVDRLKEEHGRILARAQHAARFIARRKQSRRMNPVVLTVEPTGTGARWTATLRPNARSFHTAVVILTVVGPSGEPFAAGLEAMAAEWKGFEPWTP